MRMASVHIFSTLIFLAWLTSLGRLAYGQGEGYVEEACNVTLHRDLCIRTLASFSRSAKRSPSRWARAGVSVAVGEDKGVAQLLIKLKKSRVLRGRDRAALSDCIECFQDAIDELHKSLDVLRKLNQSEFETQMGDLNTWTSAALTDADTCSDGFEGRKGKQVQLVQNRVVNATYITSNALALVNKLATTGLASLTDP